MPTPGFSLRTPHVDKRYDTCTHGRGLAGSVQPSLLRREQQQQQKTPQSPDASLPPKSSCPLLLTQLAGAKVVVGSSDGGPDAEEAPPGLADEIVTALPSETQYLVWVDSPEAREAGRLAKKDMGFLDGLLGGGFKVGVLRLRLRLMLWSGVVRFHFL